MRFLQKVLAFALLFALVLSVPVHANTKAMVTGSKVNMRQGPSETAAVYDTVPIGTLVNVIELEGDFYKINHHGQTLFMHKEYVSVVSGTGRVNASNVNIRKYPAQILEPIAQADLGDVFEVTGRQGDWVAIIYQGTGAFIHKDYITVTDFESLRKLSVDIPEDEAALGLVAAGKNEYYAVTTAGLRMRELPSTDSKILGTYSVGTTLDIVANQGDWIKVKLDGVEGYMSAEFIAIKEGKRPENHKGQRVVDFARKYLGTPYVWGGTSLTSGVDCSGFVYSVYKNFGITLNRTSRYQYGNGFPVKKAELQIGDLVFFDTDGIGGISHVGIYMGGGQFIHSSSAKSAQKVTISSLHEAYYVRTYYGACRVL